MARWQKSRREQRRFDRIADQARYGTGEVMHIRYPERTQQMFREWGVHIAFQDPALSLRVLHGLHGPCDPTLTADVLEAVQDLPGTTREMWATLDRGERQLLAALYVHWSEGIGDELGFGAGAN